MVGDLIGIGRTPVAGGGVNGGGGKIIGVLSTALEGVGALVGLESTSVGGGGEKLGSCALTGVALAAAIAAIRVKLVRG